MRDLAIFVLETAEVFFPLVSEAVRASAEDITQVLQRSALLSVAAPECCAICRTAASEKLHCRKQACGKRHLWVAPALQAFSGGICGHFCQYCRLSGLFVWWCSTGPDEFRERGSNRLIDLKGPLPFPECPCSWLTYFRIITSTSCISWAVGAVRTQAAGIPVFS
ncbi:hypothetical protein [Qingshengfaniella alkalisoli]|uniref:Uncharacterized protein n=1 Tax=Qingshengfaniella alkalisoli TaxID=2599296 RepID=A0A5B8JB83_9RHOB|nr:hypothetical protein [Qingshengfaniella alkalisoli]QDY71420.1 hypothetical protein FPZ52_17200 [Qingshengfaniella alkalisoli]